MATNIVGGLTSSLSTVSNLVISTGYSLTMFGTPSIYNSAGVNLGTTVTNGFTYYYLGGFPSNGNTNFTPIIVSNTKFKVPVNGLYSVKFTLASLQGSNLGEPFITKNMGNNNDLDPGDDRLVSVTQISPVQQFTLTGNVALTTSDYLSFGIFFLNGATFTTTVVGRNSIQMFCIQRTA